MPPYTRRLTRPRHRPTQCTHPGRSRSPATASPPKSAAESRKMLCAGATAGRSAAVCSSRPEAIEAQSYRNLKCSVLIDSNPVGVKFLVLAGVHVNLARGDQVHVRNLRAEPHIPPARFLLCFRNERQQVLMLPSPAQILQIRRKGHRSPRHSDVICRPASSIRYLRQVKLSPVALPIIVPE